MTQMTALIAILTSAIDAASPDPDAAAAATAAAAAAEALSSSAPEPYPAGWVGGSCQAGFGLRPAAPPPP